MSGIYTLACLLMLAFVPPVINAHGYKNDEDADGIESRLHAMKLSTWILATIFAALCAINLFFCKVYARKEEKAEEVRRRGNPDYLY